MASIIEVLERLGVASRQRIAEELGVSQPTFSRLFQAHSDQLVQLGRGRSVRYTLRKPLSRVKSPIPVWRVSPGGLVRPFGELEPVVHSKFLFDSQLFDDLPWFLWDMRPQGFMGRAFARRETGLGLPQNLLNWSSEDILVALTWRGEDCPGDLIAGHESLERYLSGRLVAPRVSRADYPELANAALEGGEAGSSAGGEQPKFAVTLAPDGENAIVKFSPPVHESAAARRWGDLLVCEHIALTVMRDHGQEVAPTMLIEGGGRIMLESARFDRTPEGRRAMLSGTAIDMQFAGVGEDWAKLGEALLKAHVIPTDVAETLGLWSAFGRLIGNSDMHLGNVSFLTEDYRQFTLAPAYDMLPMRWAPSTNGEIVERELDIPVRFLVPCAFGLAADMAEDFWTRVRSCEWLEGRWSGIAETASMAVAQAREKMRLLRG
ncbi:HipA-like N-terminal domain-containing protein [Methylomagnum ishizawai]|uniref:HipA-like N-terminal domain-containing protein n=1 Tax=Methylomagnum ishizawai TaxID=1760988 RepID=A0A1Y6D2Q6_9GAMM|nr:type II toxin-antitoxin system HipA family toxin YjjJ [Methylomagnum ishizawai]SMF94654.1 HipA-like N-terminal domain-containing protein [Methylomagnum ishizawai]